MDEVKRKVLLDLFASPLTLLPVAGGLTALMASWALNGDPTLTFAGLAGVLGGVGLCVSRLILGLEGITQRSYDYFLEKQRKQREESLDALHEKLSSDQDPRTENCLRELRLLYGSLQTAAEKGKITAASYEVLGSVGKVFEQCVKQLRHSHSLWETASRLRGPARESLLQQRNEVVQEVCDTVIEMGQKVDRFLLSETRKNRSELSQLREELDETIEAARRAEERTAELERSARYEVSDFE